LTAYSSSTDRDMALAAGFDWHMAKPVDADELVRSLPRCKREITDESIDRRTRHRDRVFFP
jgi:CheY-like chemotaxis protein